MAWRRGTYGLLSRLLSNGPARTHNSLGNNVSTQKAGSTTLLSSDNTGHHFLTLKDIPGPRPSVPFIGTAWQYFRWGRYNLTNIHESCIDKYIRYGPIVKEEFQWRKPVVHLYRPDDFQTVSKYQGNRPIRPTSEFVKHYRENNPEKYDTVGLANSQGEEWERLRKILGPVLLKPNAMDYLLEPMNDICDDLGILLQKERDPQTFCISSLQDQFYKFSLESIIQMSLDKRLGCLDLNLPPNSAASYMIGSAKDQFESFQDLYYGLPLWKLFPTSAYKKLDKAESIMYEVTSNRIQEVIEELRNQSPEEAKPGVLQTLINSKELTDKEIRVTIIDIISGGIYTMTNALCFLMHHMATNLDVQEKLYKELIEIFPDKVVTSKGLEKSKYLKACSKESFRLTPTIPTITRILPEDIVASGYHIPAGTPVFCNYTVPCMQAHEFPDPGRFLPERWLTKSSRSFRLLPFGFGLRMCIGRRFAEMEMHMVLAKLVLNFVMLPTGQDLKCKQAFIIVPSHPVSIRFKDRDSC